MSTFKSNFKTALKALAVTLCVCVLFATIPTVWAINDENNASHCYEKNDSDDAMFALMDAFDAIVQSSFDGSDGAMCSIAPITLIMRGIIDSETLGVDKNITITNVQFVDEETASSPSLGVQSSGLNQSGKLRIYYDDGASWYECAVNISTNVQTASTSSPSANSYGFVLPIDNMNLTSNLTCSFNCEADGQLCSWCVSHGYTTLIRSKPHNGQDISFSGISGRYIRAVASGTTRSLYDSDYGYYVTITHDDGSVTKYAHMIANTNLDCYVNQGDIIGQVGNTGLSTGAHLHFQLEIPSGNPVDPVPYLQGAETFVPSFASPKTYIIVDGPLNLRSEPLTTSTSAGTLTDGTEIKISELSLGNNDFIFGLISEGIYAGKWIAVGTVNGDMYAVNISDRWRVLDGDLNVRENAASSASSYGVITNGSTFYITDAVKNGDFIFGKISASPSPILHSSSTCSVSDTIGHWVAINYCVNG